MLYVGQGRLQPTFTCITSASNCLLPWSARKPADSSMHGLNTITLTLFGLEAHGRLQTTLRVVRKEVCQSLSQPNINSHPSCSETSIHDLYSNCAQSYVCSYSAQRYICSYCAQVKILKLQKLHATFVQWYSNKCTHTADETEQDISRRKTLKTKHAGVVSITPLPQKQYIVL